MRPRDGPVCGSAQNPDAFFQDREATYPFYLAVPGIAEERMRRLTSGSDAPTGWWTTRARLFGGWPCWTAAWRPPLAL